MDILHVRKCEPRFHIPGTIGSIDIKIVVWLGLISEAIFSVNSRRIGACARACLSLLYASGMKHLYPFARSDNHPGFIIHMFGVAHNRRREQ